MSAMPMGMNSDQTIGWIASQIVSLTKSHDELRDELRLSRTEQRQENHDLEIRLTDLLAPIHEKLKEHAVDIQDLKDSRRDGETERRTATGISRWLVRAVLAVLPFAAGWFGRDLPR
jgi:hypothetical protein